MMYKMHLSQGDCYKKLRISLLLDNMHLKNRVMAINT